MISLQITPQKWPTLAPKKGNKRSKKKDISRIHIGLDFLQKNGSKLLKFGPCGAIYILQQLIWVVFPRTGKMSKICHNFFSLELYCDQTVLFFQVFSIVLKSFCPLQSKNTFVLVLALFFLFLKKYFFCPKIKFFGQIYCIFNVLVRPNLQRWTGFDLLII